MSTEQRWASRAGLAEKISAEVLSWTGVTSEPGRFGSEVFRYGRREIGHLHGYGDADIPLPKEARERVLAGGRARRHAFSEGFVSYPMRDREDAAAITEAMRANYERAREAAERRAAREGDPNDDSKGHEQ